MNGERRYRRWENALRWPMTALAVLFLVLLLLPLQTGVPPSVLAWGQVIETAIWIIFVAEFMLLLVLAPDKSDYLSSHIIEALGVMLPALRVFRVFRLLRFARFLRFGRTPFLLLATVRNLRRARALFNRFRLGYVLLVTMVLLMGGAGLLYLSEGASQSAFASYARCLWWCVFSLVSTSLDLGMPQTPGGFIVGMLMMVLGIALAGIFTATVASVFVRTESKRSSSAERLRKRGRL